MYQRQRTKSYVGMTTHKVVKAVYDNHVIIIIIIRCKQRSATRRPVVLVDIPLTTTTINIMFL